MRDDSSSISADHWLTRLHVWARRGAIFAVTFTALAILIDVGRNSASSPAPPGTTQPGALDADTDVETGASERPHYRHSVIPGGAYSGQELAAIIRRDAVVAAHHGTVDLSRVRATVTPAARMAYVSYRVGDRVFWTRKPVLIPAGETLLTDGEIEIRARCGNGVSDIAREPVSDVEPLAAELDDLSTTGEQTLVNTAPLGTPYVPFLQQAQGAFPGDGAGLPEDLRALGGAGPLALGFLGTSGPIGANPTSPSFGGSPSARGEPFDSRVSSGGGFLTSRGGSGDLDGPGNGDGADPYEDSSPGDPKGGSDPDGTIPTTYPGAEDVFEDEETPAVPEPAALTLLGLGLAAAVLRRQRR